MLNSIAILLDLVYIVGTQREHLLSKVNNSKIRKMCEICSKLSKRHQNDASNIGLVSLHFS